MAAVDADLIATERGKLEKAGMTFTQPFAGRGQKVA